MPHLSDAFSSNVNATNRLCVCVCVYRLFLRAQCAEKKPQQTRIIDWHFFLQTFNLSLLFHSNFKEKKDRICFVVPLMSCVSRRCWFLKSVFFRSFYSINSIWRIVCVCICIYNFHFPFTFPRCSKIKEKSI